MKLHKLCYYFTFLYFIILPLNVLAEDGKNIGVINNEDKMLISRQEDDVKNTSKELIVSNDKIEEDVKMVENSKKSVNENGNNGNIEKTQIKNKDANKKKIKYIAVPIEEYEKNNFKSDGKKQKTQEEIDKEYNKWFEEDEKKPYFVFGIYLGATDDYKNAYFHLGTLGDYVFNTGKTAFFIGYDFRWYVLLGNNNNNLKEVDREAYYNSNGIVDRHIVSLGVRLGHRFRISSNKYNYIAPYIIGGGNFVFSNEKSVYYRYGIYRDNGQKYKGAGWSVGAGIDFVFSYFLLKLEYRYMNEVSQSFIGNFGHTVGISFGIVSTPIRHTHGYFCTQCGRYYYINGYHCDHDDYRLSLITYSYYNHPRAYVHTGLNRRHHRYGSWISFY